MRISEFENDEALDLLADIMDPISDIMGDKVVEGMVKAKKPTLLIAKYALKNYKKSVIEIVALLNKTTPDKVRFNVIGFLKDIVDLITDLEGVGLFTLQGQTLGEDNSGSATENTEDGEQ